MEKQADLPNLIKELYERGQYLQAYAAGQPLGKLAEWPGAEARVLAGRLAINLGAPRLSRVLCYRAWRAEPDLPLACYFYAISNLTHRGPLGTWNFLEAHGDLPDAPVGVRADWCAMCCHVLAMMRDFQRSEEWFRRAEDLAGDRAWIWVERAGALEMEDRHDEALEAAHQALSLQPWYRPAVQAAAHHLIQVGRDEEAVQLMTEAAEHVESGHLIAQLAALQTELGHYADARANYQRLPQFYPLLEKQFGQWLAGCRANAAYFCDDFAEAARLARQAEGPFFEQMAERLSAEPLEGRRVELAVPFVRQHHVTCAPATLSAISRFWSMPADHLELAEKICYDGTSAYSERSWAEENGWAVREFTVTWDAAVALIDRGVPFTLVTVDAGSAHLMAVVGYDSRRGTLIVRDPSHRNTGEGLADEVLKHYRATGPRGMALVPREKAELLDEAWRAEHDGLELPDAALHDKLHALRGALEAHDRDRAEQVLREMRAAAPDHRMTLWARYTLAAYDANPAAVLQCTEQLLGQFPDDAVLQLTRLGCLQDLGRREQRIELLENLLADKETAAPVFLHRYARELNDDARNEATVVRLLRRAIRQNPHEAAAYSLLADVRWQRHRRQALQLYRLTACLHERNEQHAQTFFIASRHFKQAATALGFLEDRFARFGQRSAMPLQTLCWALEELERSNEAFQFLRQGLELRPDDGGLKLYAADFHVRYGKADDAATLLEQARSVSRKVDWLRMAAQLAAYDGDFPTALGHWRAVVDAEPLAIDAIRSAADLLEKTEGPAAARAYLRELTGRFPHHYALNQLLIEWLRDEDPAEAQAAVARLIEINPADAWARRELALTLAKQSRIEEAFAEAEIAGQLEPDNPATHGVLGQLYRVGGKPAKAREHCRQAIRLSVDCDLAISDLMLTCSDEAQRREQLDFVRGQLTSQVIFGEGLTAYRQAAAETLEPEALLGVLCEALDARPDLWHAWSAVVRQLVEMQRHDEAMEPARRAADRFPLLLSAWLDLAAVCQAREDRQGEIDALQHAAEVTPAGGPAVRLLAEVYLREDDAETAKTLLGRAKAENPGDPFTRGCLADALWQLDDRQAAVEQLTAALRINPYYDWAWETLRQWLQEQDEPQHGVDLARELTR